MWSSLKFHFIFLGRFKAIFLLVFFSLSMLLLSISFSGQADEGFFSLVLSAPFSGKGCRSYFVWGRKASHQANARTIALAIKWYSAEMGSHLASWFKSGLLLAQYLLSSKKSRSHFAHFLWGHLLLAWVIQRIHTLCKQWAISYTCLRNNYMDIQWAQFRVVGTPITTEC